MYSIKATVAAFVAYLINTSASKPIKAADVEGWMNKVQGKGRALYAEVVDILNERVLIARSILALALYRLSVRLTPKAIPVNDPVPNDPPLFLAFNKTVVEEIWQGLTLPPVERVEVSQNAPQSQETASPDAVPHIRKVGTGKRKRYRYFKASYPVAGQIYWYKQGRRWVEMIAPYSEAA